MSVHIRRLRPFRAGDHASADRHAHGHADGRADDRRHATPDRHAGPYTPAPTATPTITPTPIVYRIQRGDNLMKIAGQFGVSVRSLQDINGITDPRALRVGQELLIPGAEDDPEGAGATPTSEATPLPFAVENVTFSNSPLGGLWAFGEIHNTTGTDLEQAGVSISLLDAAGAAVAAAQDYVQVELIRPGGRAPFALRFDAPPQSFASYLAAPWKGVIGYVGGYYLDLAARDAQGAGERYSTYTVSGSIANTGPEDAVEVSVTVTLYDALGRVIGTRRAPPEYDVIPTGGQSPFVVELTPAGGPVAQVPCRRARTQDADTNPQQVGTSCTLPKTRHSFTAFCSGSSGSSYA